MSAIATTDVTYTQVGKAEVNDSSYRKRVMTIAFGNGALTYPAGGIPLVAGNMGCPNQVKSVSIFSPASSNGLFYKYDQANNKIRIYNTLAGHTHDLFLNNADQADGATTRVNAAAGKLGANTGSDITITGVADTSGSGGILPVAAGGSAELATTAAPAAATLYIEVLGY